MTVIGIDPGIEKTGIGIIESYKGNYKLIFEKLIKTNSKLNYYKRLSIIDEEFNEILNNFKIDSAAIEKVFFAKNVKTALIISEVRGILLLSLFKKNISIFEYTPLQVKQSIAGYGNADKTQVQKFIKILLKLENIPKSDDVADGMALAIVHLNSYKVLSKINKGKI